MRFTDSTTTDGVLERRFRVDDAPGVLWTPGDGAPRALVLIAHGGGRSKTAEQVVAAAHRFVRAFGFGALALDAPGHGERPPTDAAARFGAGLRERFATGRPVLDHVTEFNERLAEHAVPEWRAALAALTPDVIDERTPIGLQGVSMGGALGLHLVAAEPRIRAAALGLVGGAAAVAAASRIDVPVRFLVQWDDELVPRDAALAVFDALGGSVKSLHANPGPHAAVPAQEYADAARFLAEHLEHPTPRTEMR